MNTCKTCSHWKYPAKVIHPSWVAKAAGGICEHEKFTEEMSDECYSPDAIVYSYMEGGDFWTGPNFGCVHHSPVGEQSFTESNG